MLKKIYVVATGNLAGVEDIHVFADKDRALSFKQSIDSLHESYQKWAMVLEKPIWGLKEDDEE